MAFPLPLPMRRALDLAAAAAAEGEVPVGAVIARGEEIIATSANMMLAATIPPLMPRSWRFAVRPNRWGSHGSTASTCG